MRYRTSDPSTRSAGSIPRAQVPVHAAALRYLRMTHGLSGQQFAVQVGISPSYVSKLERGERSDVSVDVFTRMCRAFGLDNGDTAVLRATPRYDDQVPA